MTLGRWSNFSDDELEHLLDLCKNYFDVVPESPSEGGMLELEEQIAWELAMREDLARSA